jgi:hypothetical protein
LNSRPLAPLLRDQQHGNNKMNSSLVPLAWIFGSTLFFFISIWIAIRLIRWAKKGSKGATLLGWGMGLPAAGVNPIPPPQVKIEELTREIQGRKNSDSADPDK